ncbi:hypothetical protein AN219_28155, partial [Streptomyces nanshensis]
AFHKSSEKGYAHVDVSIRQDGGDAPEGRDSLSTLDQRVLDKASDLPGAKSATGVVSGFAALSDKDGKLVGDGFSTQGANY